MTILCIGGGKIIQCAFTFQEFTLHLSAVEKVLSDLESPLGKDKPADNLSRWLNDVRLSQNVINSVLSLGSRSDAAARLRFIQIVAC